MLAELESSLNIRGLQEDDSVTDRGLRYSPQALRMAGYAVARGSDSITYIESIAFFLASMGAISSDEHYSFFRDSRRRVQLTFDAITPSVVSPVRNVIRPNLESVSEDVRKIRSVRGDVVVVFNHGRWNYFPHYGYMAMYLSVIQKLKQFGYTDDKVVFVVAHDNNKEIEMTGAVPFMNTAWRISANSYLPYDFLCGSGEFYSLGRASDHWKHNYEILKPDYVVVNPDDALAKQQVANINDAHSKALVCRTIKFLTNKESGEVKDVGFHGSDLKNLSDVDLLTFVQIRNLFIRLMTDGAFKRSVSWRDFLIDKGWL